MVQQGLDFSAPARETPAKRKRKPSLTDKLEAYFRANPMEWTSALHMAVLVGVSGVRQRRLEVEKRGLTLERQEWTDERGRHHIAFRYVPSGAQRSGA
jgi:hypothetical protein